MNMCVIYAKCLRSDVKDWGKGREWKPVGLKLGGRTDLWERSEGTSHWLD